LIICKSNNFVVVRPPKTASTSLLYYFLNSNLIDCEQDKYMLDEKAESVHTKFKDLITQGLIEGIEPCVSTIRNPLERISSAFYYVKKNLHVSVLKNWKSYKNPNTYLDDLVKGQGSPGVKDIACPQCNYFPEHAELFNTENLHEHVSKYILERGGKVDKRIEMRKNPDNNLNVFLATLTPDRKQSILDTYSKDFELWEKAYAVYN